MRLSEVAERLGAVLEGDASLEVAYVNSLEKARPGEISFLSSDRYRSLLEKSQATAVLVPAGFEGSASCALLRVKNPDRSFGEAAALKIASRESARNCSISVRISSILFFIISCSSFISSACCRI